MISKTEKRFCILCSILLILLFVISILIVYLFFSSYQSRQERAVYTEKKEIAITVVPDTILEDNNVPFSSEENIPDRKVDFEYLEDYNPLIGSWIYIPDTVIDYPVVQGINNTIYLNYDAYGNESSSGAIFIDCLNNPDFSDYHTIIYGHNKRDGSMFHTLHNYTDTEFAKKHSSMILYMNTGEIHTYQLLCTLTADGYDAKLYTKNTLDNAELFEYLLNKSDYVYGVDNGNNLVSLSTCIKGNSRRVVVFQEIL